MKNIRHQLNFILAGFMILISCNPDENIKPKDDRYEISEFKENMQMSTGFSRDRLITEALKFEATHQVPIPQGGDIPEMPPPLITPGNGNRIYLEAAIMTTFSGVTPSDASDFLTGSFLFANLKAFWKIPDSDPASIMLGTGPAKGEFSIERNGALIWKGTITGIRSNVGTKEQPVFQWKGQVQAEGLGPFEGLKLSATETTDPSPYPAMVYYWSGVITP